MKEPSQIAAKGTKLVVTRLDSITGMLVRSEYLANRRARETVEMIDFVPGHGGDVWWCRHDNGDVAVYGWWELEYPVDYPDWDKWRAE